MMGDALPRRSSVLFLVLSLFRVVVIPRIGFSEQSFPLTEHEVLLLQQFLPVEGTYLGRSSVVPVVRGNSGASRGTANALERGMTSLLRSADATEELSR